MHRRLFLVTVLSLLCTVFPARGAVSYNISANNQISGPAIVGQTLTAPSGSTILDSFTVRVRPNGSAATFVFDVSVWESTNTRVLGAPLFTSATQTVQPSADYVDFTFNPNLSLAAGSRYVAYVDATGSSTPLIVGGNSSNPYPDGAFAFAPGLVSSPWIEAVNGQDLAFAATFIPEPQSASVAIALLLVWFSNERRRVAWCFRR